MPHYLFLLANQWFSFQFCLLSNTWWTRLPKKKSHIWGKICLIARWNYVESRDGRDSWATFPYLSFNLYIFFKWFPILLFQLVKDYQAWASGDASRKPLGTGEIWSCPVASTRHDSLFVEFSYHPLICIAIPPKRYPLHSWQFLNLLKLAKPLLVPVLQQSWSEDGWSSTHTEDYSIWTGICARICTHTEDYSIWRLHILHMWSDIFCKETSYCN